MQLCSNNPEAALTCCPAPAADLFTLVISYYCAAKQYLLLVDSSSFRLDVVVLIQDSIEGKTLKHHSVTASHPGAEAAQQHQGYLTGESESDEQKTCAEETRTGANTWLLQQPWS